MDYREIDIKIINEKLTHIIPVMSNSSIGAVFDYFIDNKNINFFPVINHDHEPLGIVSEKDFKAYVYSPYGKDLLMNRSFIKTMDDFLIKCPIVEISDGIEKILEEHIESKESCECVILKNNGKYKGVLTNKTLISIIHEKNIYLKEIESITKTAVTAGDKINTPLSVINGRLHMLEKRFLKDNDEKLLKHLRHIKISAEKIKETVDKMKEIKEVTTKEYKLDGVRMLDL